MNPREVVKATIEFRGPERIPYEIWIDTPRFRRDRGAEYAHAVEQVVAGALKYIVELWPAPVKEWRSIEAPTVDEWGVTWYDCNAIGHPLKGSWGLLDDYPFPDPDKAGRFDHIPAEMEQNRDNYLLGVVPATLFERIFSLRGFENALTDPYLDYDRFIYLRDRIMEFDMGILRQWLEIGVDGVFFQDDWGSQQSLLINPNDWRKLYKPCYERLFDTARQGGARVWLHSDGNIGEIVPDLIEIGLDVLNPVQPRALDVDELGNRFGGELCFWGGADVQATLPRGTPDDIEQEVRHLIETLGRFDGGYIGGTSHTILPDTPLENIRALFDAFKKYSKIG